jgi:NAD(P)-dependent dehydrogenase (short-subunit alcohol dehydrogenase family)
MDLQLQNKIVIVTGGAKGIGEGIVQVLAGEGAIPVIVGRNQEDNQKVVDDLASKGFESFQVIAELTKPEDSEKAVAAVLEKYGRIDGLVNNAGVNDGVGLENGSYEGFVASLHKNVVHYYLMAHYALPALKASKGSIVNISSKTADTGQGGTSAYAAANGGRNALTREWAVELLKYGIRVGIMTLMLLMMFALGFYIIPQINEIQAHVTGPVSALAATDPLRIEFDRLHSYSNILFSIAALGGLALCWWEARE